MNVVLDVDPISPPLTGIGRYTLELARGLRKDARVEDLRLFSYGRWIEDPDTLLDPGRASVALKRSVPFRSLARNIYRRFSKWRFEGQMARLSNFVYHSPNYTLLPYAGPSVVTVHDLSVLRHPEFHPRERVEFLRRELPQALRQAACVLTDTDFVRSELEELCGVPRARSRTVYLGVDPSFQPTTAQQAQALLQRLRLRYGSYLLSVGTAEPRKNLTRLVTAFASLPQPIRRQFPLVLAGARGWGESALQREADALLNAGEIIPLGFVSEQDLATLYGSAAAFVYPSIYEGFGLPALEAMACGTAVIASGTTSLPEVVGDAARIVDPSSTDSIREAMLSLLTHDSSRLELAQKGVRRAASFTWQRCVEETVTTYCQVG